MAANRTICISTFVLSGTFFVLPVFRDLPDLAAGYAMALELAIICAVAGAILGLRCNALVLVPTITAAVILAMMVGVARAHGVWSIALMTAALGSAVQLGYLAGTMTRAMMGLSARPWRKAPVGNSAPR
jgi:hypothetical protein